MSRNCMLALAVCALCLILVPGCALPPEARQIVGENAALQARFVSLMDDNLVSQEQLRENARVNAENWQRLNTLLMGD